MKPAQITRTISSPLSWSEIPWGEYYRAALEQQLTPWWPKLFGYHLLKIGPLSSQISTEKCGISHQVSIGEKGDNMQVIADPYRLPFLREICGCVFTLTYAEFCKRSPPYAARSGSSPYRRWLANLNGI